LLVQFSHRLVQCVRIRDTVGRLGGDEFAMILVMQDGHQGAAIVANKIREVLRAPFILHGHEVSVTASIGITVHPRCADTRPCQMADTAMYWPNRRAAIPSVSEETQGTGTRGVDGPAQSRHVSGRQFSEGEVNGDVLQALRDNDITADLLELDRTHLAETRAVVTFRAP
jgi:hypothetical protein